MTGRFFSLLVLPMLLLIFVPVVQVCSADEPFELHDGDRVVFLGNTLIERSQKYGYLESLLTSHYPDRHLVFRNLGWSGDTVFGDARERFGTLATDPGWAPPKIDAFRKITEGFRHLNFHVHAVRPTVIIIGYGANAAHAGKAGLPRFLQGLDKLLYTLADTKARIVLLSPLRHENLGSPLPDPTEHNLNIRLYCDALRQVAEQRDYAFVDLYELMARLNPNIAEPLQDDEQLTDNGIHLSGYGYWRVAPEIAKTLGMSLPTWQVQLDVRKKTQNALGTKLSRVDLSAQRVEFSALDHRLPMPLPPRYSPAKAKQFGSRRLLSVRGLGPGRYRLTIDGIVVTTTGHDRWAEGVHLSTGPEHQQAETLRQTILAKNLLFFHRWRPQNETYLYLFRKHEQGNNAREIPMFDPLVKQKEESIAILRVPVRHQYILSREADK